MSLLRGDAEFTKAELAVQTLDALLSALDLFDDDAAVPLVGALTAIQDLILVSPPASVSAAGVKMRLASHLLTEGDALIAGDEIAIALRQCLALAENGGGL